MMSPDRTPDSQAIKNAMARWAGEVPTDIDVRLSISLVFEHRDVDIDRDVESVDSTISERRALVTLRNISLDDIKLAEWEIPFDRLVDLIDALTAAFRESVLEHLLQGGIESYVWAHLAARARR